MTSLAALVAATAIKIDRGSCLYDMEVTPMRTLAFLFAHFLLVLLSVELTAIAGGHSLRTAQGDPVSLHAAPDGAL